MLHNEDVLLESLLWMICTCISCNGKFWEKWYFTPLCYTSHNVKCTVIQIKLFIDNLKILDICICSTMHIITYMQVRNKCIITCMNRIARLTCKYKLDYLCMVYLKLYCGYKYTRPYMINRIWSLKQLWLQVNGHAWFHLHGLRWPFGTGGSEKFKMEIYVSSGIGTNTTPVHDRTVSSLDRSATLFRKL